MPRYFFNLADSTREPDVHGVELAGDNEARLHALEVTGDAMRERAKSVWSDGALEVSVSSETGLTLFMVTVVVTNSAAAPARDWT